MKWHIAKIKAPRIILLSGEYLSSELWMNNLNTISSRIALNKHKKICKNKIKRLVSDNINPPPNSDANILLKQIKKNGKKMSNSLMAQFPKTLILFLQILYIKNPSKSNLTPIKIISSYKRGSFSHPTGREMIQMNNKR